MNGRLLHFELANLMDMVMEINFMKHMVNNVGKFSSLNKVQLHLDLSQINSYTYTYTYIYIYIRYTHFYIKLFKYLMQLLNYLQQPFWFRRIKI
jgi:hypothetical protein